MLETKKINLYVINRDNTEDKFQFNTLSELFDFINKLTAEKLIDSNFAELEYTILVEE